MGIRHRLSRRLLALVIASCLLSGLIAGVWISLSSEREATATLIGSLALAADHHQERLAQELARKTRAGVAIAGLLQAALIDPQAPRHHLELARGGDGAVRAFVGDYGAYLAKRSELTPELRRDIEVLFHIGPLLGRMAALDFHNFYFEAAAGDLLFETPKDWPMEVQSDEDYRPYFALVAPHQDPARMPAWKPVYYDGIQKLWMTSLRVPLYDGERFLGAVGFDYVLDSLLLDLRELGRVERWCAAFLFSASGDLIVHPDYMDRIQASSLNHAPLATADIANAGVATFVKEMLARSMPSLDGQRFNDGDEATFASVRAITPLEWHLVLYSPARSVTAPLRGTQLRVIATSIVLAILLALALDLVFRRVVLNRLAALADATRQLGGGQWDAALPEVRDDEIGSLTASIGEMAGRLRDLVTDLEGRVNTRTAELARATTAAQSANHAKSAFLSRMSHEIRTPLNAMLGYAQLLGRDTTLAPAQRQALAVIDRSGEHLLQLINDILELSRIESGRSLSEPGTVDLTALLAGLDGMFRQRAQQQGLDLVISLADDAPRHVAGDERKLRQILINLLANAVKFTRSGRVALHLDHTQGRLVVTVADTGIGIAPEELAQLFQPFFQAEAGRRRSDGSGLGLALSHGLAQVLGGSLAGESTPGAGTCFTLVVPAEAVAAASAPAPQRRVAGLAPGQQPPRVLVAEDHDDSRELLVTLLRSLGCEVRAATDGAAAVAACQASMPELVWMDIDLPLLDGLAATRAIRAMEGPRPVIVALTAAAFAEDRPRLLAAGCDEVVHKPWREDTLFATMERLLGTRFAWDEVPAHPTVGLDDVALAAGLRRLPQALREQLRLLLVTGDVAAIPALFAGVPERQVAEAVTALAAAYAMDRLLALLDARDIGT